MAPLASLLALGLLSLSTAVSAIPQQAHRRAGVSKRRLGSGTGAVPVVRRDDLIARVVTSHNGIPVHVKRTDHDAAGSVEIDCAPGEQGGKGGFPGGSGKTGGGGFGGDRPPSPPGSGANTTPQFGGSGSGEHGPPSESGNQGPPPEVVGAISSLLSPKPKPTPGPSRETCGADKMKDSTGACVPKPAGTCSGTKTMGADGVCSEAAPTPTDNYGGAVATAAAGSSSSSSSTCTAPMVADKTTGDCKCPTTMTDDGAGGCISNPYGGGDDDDDTTGGIVDSTSSTLTPSPGAAAAAAVTSVGSSNSTSSDSDVSYITGGASSIHLGALTMLGLLGSSVALLL